MDAANPLHPAIVPLLCAPTHHHWGAPAAASAAARLYSLNRGAALSLTKPYSEFVVSASGPTASHLAPTTQHPDSNPDSNPDPDSTNSNPQSDNSDDTPLTLAAHVHAQVIEVDAGAVPFYTRLHAQGLPYSLRVVSAVSPTGLRVHPARPVMLVALASARVLAAFRPVNDVVADLLRVPEFADAAGRPTTDRFVHVVKSGTPRASHLRDLVAALFDRAATAAAATPASAPAAAANGDAGVGETTGEPTTPPTPQTPKTPSSPSSPSLPDSLSRAAARLRRMPAQAVTDADRDFLALQAAFPTDPMCFAVYLLNRVDLPPGHAVFVAPAQPYCLLRGDVVEAAGADDAVFFGGLLPRPADEVRAFADALNYDGSTVEPSAGERFSDYGVSFVPPVDEFQMLQFKLPGGISQQMARTLAPSIVVVLGGEGVITVDEKDHTLPMRPGSVYYLTPRTHFTVTSRDVGAGPLHMFQIGVNESAAPTSSTSCTIM